MYLYEANMPHSRKTNDENIVVVELYFFDIWPHSKTSQRITQPDDLFYQDKSSWYKQTIKFAEQCEGLFPFAIRLSTKPTIHYIYSVTCTLFVEQFYSY